MYEHAIPQNIMEYEFKLFAGLTLKQFIYVAMTGLAAFALYELTIKGLFPAFFAWLTIPTVLVIGITMGVGSLQKRTMEDWFTAFLRANNMALRRVWKKDKQAITLENFFNTKPESMPAYLAVYFMNHDEYNQLMASTFGQESSNQHQPQAVATMPSVPTVSETLEITAENVLDYAEPGVTLPAIPNTVAFKLQEDGLAIEGVVAYVKDPNMSVVSALRSNKDGIIYFNQGFGNGQYEIEFQSPDAASFPKVKMQFQGSTYPLINISPKA